MFPVYVLKSDEDLKSLPESGTYYLITANGVMEHKVQGVIRSITPAERVPYLMTVEPAAAMLIPPIPPEIAYTAFHFFRAVWFKHRSESILRLFYSLDKRQFRLICPEQEVAFESIEYKRERLPGWTYVGTIHSHCDFNASHSSVDTEDEKHDDGFHATFGHVNQNVFSVVTTIVAGKLRFPQDPLKCILSLTANHQGGKTSFSFDQNLIAGVDFGQQVTEWLSNVKKKPYPLDRFARQRRGRNSEEVFKSGFSSFSPIDSSGDRRL